MSPNDLSDHAMFADDQDVRLQTSGALAIDADMVTTEALGVFDSLYDDPGDPLSGLLGDPRGPQDARQSDFPRPERLQALILDALAELGPEKATGGTPLLLFGRRGDVIARLCRSDALDRLGCDPRRLVALGLLATVADAAETLRPRHPT